MKARQIAFRADASVRIGTGHVMRCLTLARALSARGAECHFICRKLDGNLLEEIRSRGFAVYGLPKCLHDGASGRTGRTGRQATAADCDFADENWEMDAALTKAAMRGMEADWLIVDHYGIDSSWETRMHEHARRLMVVDDLANRHHFCDLLLDQNYEEEERYRNCIPGDCRVLLGPKYALLRPEFAERRAEIKEQDESIRRVLVFFGGSDPLDLTGEALKALSVPSLDHLQVDLVVGANYPHSDALNRLATVRGRTTVHGPRPHLADLMAVADIAIGAGGVTNWERMCLGLPSLVITMADNQIPISEILDRRGVIRLLGKSEGVTANLISTALLDEMRSLEIAKHRKLAMELCDGLGVERVVDAMLEAG
jgi:UDP-2,4-diacetamido-2,4,6-trideoxy-beta-L-altropyranose hydrolase